jgi:hypothetical protein
MAIIKVKRFLSLALQGFVILSVAWTCISAIKLVQETWRPSHSPKSEIAAASDLSLPRLAPYEVLRDIPGLTESVVRLYERGQEGEAGASRPSRMAVVFNTDSTCFVELTYVSDCGCPTSKIDRYEILRDVIDPSTGHRIAQFREEYLSAERVTRLLTGLTKNWRSQL